MTTQQMKLSQFEDVSTNGLKRRASQSQTDLRVIHSQSSVVNCLNDLINTVVSNIQNEPKDSNEKLGPNDAELSLSQSQASDVFSEDGFNDNWIDLKEEIVNKNQENEKIQEIDLNISDAQNVNSLTCWTDFPNDGTEFASKMLAELDFLKYDIFAIHIEEY